MTNDERDTMLKEVHDMTVRMHESLIVAKVPERVGSLEMSRALMMGFSAALGAISGWFTAHAGGSK